MTTRSHSNPTPSMPVDEAVAHLTTQVLPHLEEMGRSVMQVTGRNPFMDDADAVRTLLAAYADARQAYIWQPIETAPKGYSIEGGFHEILFRGVSKSRSFAGPVYVSGWMDDDRKPIYYYQYKLHLTHWMPIPARAPERGR